MPLRAPTCWEAYIPYSLTRERSTGKCEARCLEITLTTHAARRVQAREIMSGIDELLTVIRATTNKQESNAAGAPRPRMQRLMPRP